MGNNDLIIGIGFGLVVGALIVYLINNKQAPTYIPDNLQAQSQIINDNNYKHNDYNDNYNDNNDNNDNYNDNNNNTIYKNDEKWEIERDEDGTIKSLNIIRDVKVNK